MRRFRTASRVPVVGLALLLVLAACGTDDDGGDDPVDTEPTEEPEEPEEPADTEEPAEDDEGDGEEAAASEIGEDVEIDFWFGREDFIPDQGFDEFEEETGITVNVDVVPLEDAPADFIRNYEAGDTPDVIQVHQDRIYPIAVAGALRDMSDMWQRWEEEDPELYGELVDLAWSAATIEGTPYGVALHSGPYWFTYRADWYEEAGLEEPETWDDVLENGRILGDRGLGFSLGASRDQGTGWFLSVFSQSGGEWSETGLPQFDSEAGAYALEVYQTLAADEIADPNFIGWDSGEFRAAFLGGNAAQAQLGDNIWPEVVEQLDYPEQVQGVFRPIDRPGNEGNGTLTSAAWAYFVSEQTEHPYEVSLALRYLAQAEVVSTVAKRYQPTTNITVMESEEYAEAKPWAPEVLDAWRELEPRPGHDQFGEVEEITHDMIHAVLLDLDADPAEVAAEHQERLNALEE